MTEFVARLKQRKLVQWALAYVAFAFALIQVLDVVAQVLRGGLTRIAAPQAASARSAPPLDFAPTGGGQWRSSCSA